MPYFAAIFFVIKFWNLVVIILAPGSVALELLVSRVN